MKCIICGSRMTYFFSKKFDAFGLTTVDYWRCINCGFSMSKSHAEMTAVEWEYLNREYHSTYQGKEGNLDDPRWIERLQSQANILVDSARLGLINRDGTWLDYACGDGKLSKLLENEKYTLLKYDKYMPQLGEYLGDDQIIPKHFDFVITTSVFEHFTRREQLDAVESLVSNDGVLGLHTLVCENIPCDASWFYLLPVHCAFHTNKSMQLLLEQWGYVASVYNVESRLWLFFKKSDVILEKYIKSANQRPDGPFYIYSKGFVDYWK